MGAGWEAEGVSWGTVGLAGQVFDGPWCYVNEWDLAFQRGVGRVMAMKGAASRRAALDAVELTQGVAMRRRYEREIRKKWGER